MASDQNRFLLITYPRTASNLLLKILALETQPKVHMTEEGRTRHTHGGNGYFFMTNQIFKSRMGKRMNEWNEEEKSQVTASTQSCFNGLESYAQVAIAEGKIAFVKEHVNFIIDPSVEAKFFLSDDALKEAHPPAYEVISDAIVNTIEVLDEHLKTRTYVEEKSISSDHTLSPLTVSLPPEYGTKSTRTIGNETIFPDEYLVSWKPTFLIRHPAMVFPSYYRTSQSLFKTSLAQWSLQMRLSWQRTLHDWYVTQLADKNTEDGVEWPLVLDADDIIAEPAVVIRYSEIIGIDTTKLKFEWKPVPSDQQKSMNPLEGRFLSCLMDSSGAQKDKMAANIDIGVETVKWKKEFGDDVGEQMAKWVEDAMPDYEAMRARRLRA